MSQQNEITFEQALSVAKTFDVSSPKDSVVLYSISFLPTKQNKFDALRYIESNIGKILVDNTPCGQKLINLGLDDGTSSLTSEEVTIVWKTASERFIKEACGNVMAFVKDADARSVFVSTELPLLLENDKISKINNIDKYEFAKTFIK